MIYPYCIDKNILPINSEPEFDTFLAKSNFFFEIIKKRTVCIDCNESGMYNLLSAAYLEQRENLGDDIIKANFESFWMRHFFDKFLFIEGSCSCKDCNSCEIEKNVKSIVSKSKIKPRFVVTYKKNLSVNGTGSVDLNNYQNDVVFRNCRDNTSSEHQTAVDQADGERIIKTNWDQLIGICQKEIIIIDRNIFGYWNNNFETGLAQFVNVIGNVNSNLKLKLITRKEDKHLSKPNVSDYDIYKDIHKRINNLNSLKVEVELYDELEHERYILFDEIIGAELNRGLDTFVPRTKEDRIKITYHFVSEVLKKKGKALRNLIRTGDFKPIKNY